MALTSNWRSRPLSLVIAAAIGLWAMSLSAVGLLQPFEDRLTTARAELLTRPASGEIVIVEIDARSLAELRSWPWSRAYHAQVVRRLHEAGASIIAFDVDFSARSGAGDKELAQAIAEAGHVVMPTFAQKSSGLRNDARVLTSRPDALFGSAWTAGVNIFPDRDGVVREYPAATFIDGAVQPSIATIVAEKHGLGDRTFQPDWAIDVATMRHFSFVDVLRGSIPSDQLRNKRVLVGATAIELGDRYAVPRFGVVPGVVVQALAADSMIQNRAVHRISLGATAVGCLLIALLLAPRELRRPSLHWALAGCLILILIVGPIFVQRTWPLSVDSAAWLVAAFTAMAAQGVTEARRRLRLRAQYDGESGLPNRTVLDEVLSAETVPGSVLVTAAIDRYEIIRGAIGFAATSEMIRDSAARIGSLIGGPVYRIAPDVMAWVQPQAEDLEIEARVRKVQDEFRTPVTTSAGAVDVSITIGLERGEAGSPALLRVENALLAIASARSQGKSSEWFQAPDPQPRRELSMMSELRSAMERGRLYLTYQPKMAIKSGLITDAEGLIRWRDAHGHSVLPDQFIPLAEATGVICEVTSFALREASAALAKWAREGVNIRVAVNVSAHDLARQNFATSVGDVLREYSVPPAQLTLEVTESALIRSPAEAVATLTMLRQQGIRLSIDDYGTGQSTLSYLKHLPVNELKIDKSFVSSLATSETDMIMVRSTIRMAHELGLEVVAEGIEDEATLELLTALQCNYGQGYFIGRPVEGSELIAAMRNSGTTRLVA